MRVGEFSTVTGGDDLASVAGAVHPAITPRSTAEMVEHLHAHFGVERFDEWVVKAQPNARQIYGAGWNVTTGCARGVAARMRALAEAGLVLLAAPRRTRPDGDTAHPFDFVAIRTSKPVPKGFPALAPVAAKPRAPVVVKLPKRGDE
jgi:hypothetical protein